MGAGERRGALALIGRADLEDELQGLLDDYRLVTLVGPGGVGKTSLATQLATQVEHRFPGGVFVAELSGTSDAEDVAGLVARQLGTGSIDAFRMRAVDQATLVVLDNCESAPAASLAVATGLTEGNSAVTVVATSRSPLYALGERLVPVRPLPVPDDDPAADPTPAEELFHTRAAEAGATWARTDANNTAVRRLVQQLNGLPLAIELAAARSRVLAPAQLVELVDQQLDLLVRPGGSTERHHSLRSAIASSYEPLPADLQHTLRCLSFISTAFDLRLAHAVTGADDSEIATLDQLAQLIDASLVDTRQTSQGRTEYLLLDSIRAYGRERLEEADQWHEVGERYADAVTAFAGETVAAALVAFSPDVMGAIRANIAHLINAIGWCLEHDPSPARSYQMSLLFFGPIGGTAEIAEVARRIRDRWDQNAPLQAESFAVMGSLTYRVGRYEDGAELAARAVAHPDATDMAKFMGNRTLGYEAAGRRDAEAAVAFIEAAMPFGPAFSAAFDREIRVSRAAVEWDPANSPAAIAALEQVIDEARAAEEWVTVAFARAIVAFHHRQLGDLAGARRALEPAVAEAARSEMAWTSYTAHQALAIVEARDRRWSGAAAHFRRALDHTVGAGDIDSSATVIRTAAGAAESLGHHDVAGQLARSVPGAPGISVPPTPFESQERALRETYPVPAEPIDELIRRVRAVLDAAADSAMPDDPPPADRPGTVVTFGGGAYELDTDMCELRHEGRRVAMEPQVYDVLAYLVARRGSVVTKNEILDEVWGDRFVSESALSSRISAARKATGDSGKAQAVIRTVHGKGFAFVAEVIEDG